MHWRNLHQAYALASSSVCASMRWVKALVWGVFTLCSVLVSAQDIDSPLYTPSAFAIGVPATGLPFERYVQQSEERLRAVLEHAYFSQDSQYFGAKYPLERVVAMRAPFELRGNAAACAQSANTSSKGFLLIHGLTDSPYYLQEVARALIDRVPCSTVRALLLPGHGTVPGDTLDVSWQDWMATTEYGVESFRGEVEELYIVGFSMGSTLGLLYADEHRNNALVTGLILLSPGVRANNSLAFLAPYLRWFQDWLGQDEERDAARYESFSANAAAEFYLLASQVDRYFFKQLELPVFMAGTIDDGTVNYTASIDFFCDRTPEAHRHMLLYQGGSNQVERQCEGMQVVEASAPKQRVYTVSHTGVTHSPADAHYGYDADFSNCLHYGRSTSTYASCMNDSAATVYAERNLLLEGELEGKLIRRGSFNPHFASMIDAIVEFIVR